MSAPASRSWRDRSVLAVIVAFAGNGVLFATWASRLPTIRDLLGLSPAQIGNLLLVGAVGSVLALPFSGAVVRRLGARRAIRAAALLAGAAVAGSSIAVVADRLVLAGVGVALSGISIATWDAAMNVEGARVEQELGRAFMPRFHAAWSLGSVLGAGVGALFALVGAPLPVHVVTAGVLVVAAMWWATSRSVMPDVVPQRVPAQGVEDGSRAPAPHEPSPTPRRGSALAAWAELRTVLIGVVMLSAALTEGAANDWVALAVVDEFLVSGAWGALAFATFISAMTAMRVFGTPLIDRFGRVTVVRATLGAAAAGLLLFCLAPSLGLALAGVFVWGLGAAIGFPIGMSAAGDDPARATARISVVATIAYGAFFAGPPLLGHLADAWGYRHALLVILVPATLSMILAGVLRPAPLPPAPLPPVE